MNSQDATFGLDHLLAQAGWMQRLARGLLGAGAAADDAVQATMLTALERPPAHAGNLRAWFGTVLTNKVRAEARARRRHGEALAREPALAPITSPSPEETVSNLELQRKLATLMLDLAPETRQVIFLRYFDGLDASEIGRRLAVAPGTVRWRLKTGLDELRAKLDAGDGDGGRQWRRALLPFMPAAPPAASPAAPGTLGAIASAPKLVSAPLGALAVALALLGGGVGLARCQTREAPSHTSATLTPPVSPGPSAPEAPPPGAGAAAHRAPAATTSPERAPAAAAVRDNRPEDVMNAAEKPLAARRTAPFAAIKWDGERPSIPWGGATVELVAVEGVPVADLLARAKQKWSERFHREHFGEDLVELLTELGRPPGQEVRLGVVRPGADAPEEVTAAMTAHNRSALIRAQLMDRPAPPPAIRQFADVSPFTGLVFREDAIDVEVAGVWYSLAAIDGVSKDALVAVAQKQFGKRWQKRIAEDLVEVLTATTGQSPGTTVDLALLERASGKAVELRDVEMTEANRRRVRDSWR